MYDECMGGGGLFLFCVIWCMMSARVEVGYFCSMLFVTCCVILYLILCDVCIVMCCVLCCSSLYRVICCSVLYIM